LPAGRTLHIESIYVENADGERFKYPFKHLNGARALATHVAHGGNSYDSIGQHIIGLSEELNKLRMFKGYVSRNPIVSEAMGTISNKVFERIDQVKKEIHSLQSSNYYKAFAESFTASDAQEIPEDVVNDWVDRLTIRTFNEELKNVFPYIYKLVGEEVDVPDYDSLGNLIGTKKKRNEVNYDSFYKFHIKEEVIFDKESSRLFWRILGIAPVKNIITSQGVDLGPTELFWVYYPDIRPILATYEVYNGKNFGGRMSWEELFESRMFSARIIKSSYDNPRDYKIDQFPGFKENGILQLFEGENIKERIFSYEQDLWSY
jgi:gliding motility associated protien GldN